MEHKAPKHKIAKPTVAKHNATSPKGSEIYVIRKDVLGCLDIKQLEEEPDVNPADKPHVCPHCGICFNEITNLTKHVTIHSQYEPSKSICWCRREFSTYTELKIHQAARNCSAESNFCPYCHERLCSYGALAYHIKARHLPNCKCSVCGEEFTNKACLKAHMLNHTGSFKCCECDEVFRTADLLTAHTRGIHGKERTCQYCGRTLSTRGGLLLHIGIHTRKKAEKFSDCTKVETEADGCVSLKSNCSEETRCSQCGEVFSRAVSKKERHNHNPIICLPCTEAFSQLFGLELDA